MTPHHAFRRQPWQSWFRCLTCGHVVRSPGGHITHAVNASKRESS